VSKLIGAVDLCPLRWQTGDMLGARVGLIEPIHYNGTYIKIVTDLIRCTASRYSSNEEMHQYRLGQELGTGTPKALRTCGA
jgi:hypothetical protein